MKNNKVTFNMIASKMEKSEKTHLDIGNGLALDVVRTLPLKDSIAFMQDIVGMCFDEGSADYGPELFDFAVRAATLVYYGGIDVPKDLEKAYKVCYETTLYDDIYKVINIDQVHELTMGADRKLDYFKDLLCSSAAQKANTLMDQIGEIIKKNAEMLDKIEPDKVADALNTITEKVNKGEMEQEPKDDVGKIIMLPRPDEETGD